MAKRNTFVGLDVHKDSIAVAIAESGRFGEVRVHGTIGGDVPALERLLKALRAPSEHSSGASTRRGRITKAGNPHARRLLAEAAWAYQSVPHIGREMLKRQEDLPMAIRDLAWKAQLRLTARFRRRRARGKPRPVIATAIARELTGFVWALARLVPQP